MVFFWRSGEIRGAERAYIDDRRGPLALTAVIVTALSMIFLVAFADLMSMVRHHEDGPPPPAAAPGMLADQAAALLGSLFLPGSGSVDGGAGRL